jgi:hypothetical protein
MLLTTFFLDHFNNKTQSRKQEPQGVLRFEEDVVMVASMLGMQDYGLSITLQQFKMKVAKLTNLNHTNPLQNKILTNS